MDRKILIVFGLIIMMSFGSAQPPLNDEEIVAGDVGVGDFLDEVFLPHDELGGMISAIAEQTWREVKYGEVVIYRSLQEAFLTDFAVVSFDAGSVLDFNTQFATGNSIVSENAIIRGVNGTWTTNEVMDISDAEDYSESAGLGDTLTYDDGNTIMPTSFMDFPDGFFFDYDSGSGNESNGIALTECDETECPNLALMESLYGVTLTNYRYGDLNMMGGKRIFLLGLDVETGSEFVADLDSDGLYEFDGILGNSVDSIETQSLTICDAGTYDFYAVI